MTTIPNRGSGERLEGRTQVVIMLAIGGMAGAASFTHVHDVAVTHGQPDWIGWADATVVELMSIALGLELRRRARTNRPTAFVGTALVFFVLVSLAAQVVDAEPSIIGWLAAALPAIGFLVLAKVVLSRTAARTPDIGTTANLGNLDRADEHHDQVDDDHHQVDEHPADTTPPAPHSGPVPAGATAAATPTPIAVPTHLLPTARFAVVNHEQTTGRAITIDELAARLSIAPVVAGQLLHALDEPARINGTSVGGAR